MNDEPQRHLQAKSAGAYAARRRVLERLKLADLVNIEPADIDEGHRAHAALLSEPARYEVDGLEIEAPAGVYHPTPESSSLLFIRNILALNPPRLPRCFDIGAGSGALALFLAKRWQSDVLATDIDPAALAATEANARRNGLKLRIAQSDLFAAIDERGFDLIVFNVPMVDRAPELDIERGVLCDPDGVLLRRFAERVGEFLAPDGLSLFLLGSNTAYEALDGVDLNMWAVGLEMVGNAFWRAIIGARRKL